MAKESDNLQKRDYNENDIWQDIRSKVDILKYGSIIITVHDGKIVQVETSTKTRY